MDVHLCPHDPTWAAQFSAEADCIKAALTPLPIRLTHIGSTSIPNIFSKPIIDILGEVANLEMLDLASETLAPLGYSAKGAFGIPGRRYFSKSDESGIRSHHLHVFESGSEGALRHRAFRDYLCAFPKIAAEYSALKLQLIKNQPTDWDSYMDGKDPFIKRTEQDALAWAQTVQDFRA